MPMKLAKISCSLATVILLICLSALGASKRKMPLQGIVPDEPTAVKIAEAVFSPSKPASVILERPN